MLRTFIGGHPKELYESVKIDGGGDFAQYIHIAVPLSVPILIIQFINTFTSTYNDYAWSLLMIDNQEKQILMPVLKTLIYEATQSTGSPGVPYAMYLISGIPLAITTAVGMKFFINGDFASGLKL
jgi:ABC-type glycerol-3-phosphate transport system permease component